MRDWTDLRALIHGTEDAVARTYPPGEAGRLTAILDQAAARVRDRLDEAGIAVVDPDELHTGLTFLRLFIDQVGAALAMGQVDECFLSQTIAIARGFTAVLLDFLPAEVRRG